MAGDIGFGILGSGNMARVYGDALTTMSDGGRLVAIALGSRAGSLAGEYPGVEVEPTAEALLERSDVDVVVIATPHSTHLDLASMAAAAGKHVYLEKPMALDVDECDQIIDACNRAGVQLTVAKQSRHFEMSMRAKEYIDEGRIGELLFIRPVSATPGHGFKNVPQSWPMLASEGDAFLDWGSHACDAIRWFTGADARRVYADYDDFTGAPIPNSTALVQIRMTNRVIAQVLLSYEIGPSGFGSRRNNQYTIVGTEGSIFWDLDRVELWTGEREKNIWQLPSWTLPDFKPRDPRRIGNTGRQVNGFVESLRSGQKPKITGEDGRAAIEMTQAARLSAETGQAIELPLTGSQRTAASARAVAG
jgi:predicted dehydrogenase